MQYFWLVLDFNRTVSHLYDVGFGAEIDTLVMLKKCLSWPGTWRLTPVILATQEAELRRITSLQV
jgi:hypothetical protein